MIIFTFSVICINSIIWFKPYCKWKIWINKIEKKKMVVLFRIKNLIKRDSWNRVEERMHSFSSNKCISLYCYNKFQNKQTRVMVRVIVFNTTFNNISVISWRSVLLLEETRVSENTTDISQVTDKLYHICCIEYTLPKLDSNSQC
jgi:hypothetical protein